MTSTFFLLPPPSLSLPSWLFTLFQAPLSHPIHHRGPDPPWKSPLISGPGGPVLPRPVFPSLPSGTFFSLPCPASPITVPFPFAHHCRASKASSLLPAHPGAQGPPDRVRSGTDKPHKWAHLCPECPWPRRVHVSPLSSATTVPLLRVSLSAPVT